MKKNRNEILCQAGHGSTGNSELLMQMVCKINIEEKREGSTYSIGDVVSNRDQKHHCHAGPASRSEGTLGADKHSEEPTPLSLKIRTQRKFQEKSIPIAIETIGIVLLPLFTAV